MNKRLEENIKGLEEAILYHKKTIDSLKECCKILDEIKDITLVPTIDSFNNDISKHKALMLTAVEELRKEREEYRKIQEIPKPEAPKTDYEYIQDLINDVSDVVYNEFKVMTWSASVSADTFHKPLQHVAYKRYVIKYNVYERSMTLMDNYWDIDPLSTKAFEQFFLYDLIKTLIEKLEDAGFAVHRYEDEHHGLTCGDTHIIEIWRASDIKLI